MIIVWRSTKEILIKIWKNLISSLRMVEAYDKRKPDSNAVKIRNHKIGVVQRTALWISHQGICPRDQEFDFRPYDLYKLVEIPDSHIPNVQMNDSRGRFR